MKSKKAMGAYDMIYWIARILFVVMMLVSIYFVARIYESQQSDTADIEASVFKDYLLYNPNALSYSDPYTGRTYPGIVDLQNFDPEILESAANFSGGKEMIAANITLLDFEDNIVKQAYYNRERYLDWLPLSHETFLGRGTVLKADNRTYVLYVDEEGNREQGMLLTEILVPRT